MGDPPAHTFARMHTPRRPLTQPPRSHTPLSRPFKELSSGIRAFGTPPRRSKEGVCEESVSRAQPDRVSFLPPFNSSLEAISLTRSSPCFLLTPFPSQRGPPPPLSVLPDFKGPHQRRKESHLFLPFSLSRLFSLLFSCTVFLSLRSPRLPP